ncbi:histone deacetylase family protein [Inquilinus sp. CAU 1745]|uniref:histone deacetylase family protein n=1 Tax=Inquilinus sp. CAU 1745 TaxID=3140369 RepID=UPI00325BFFCF
MNTLLFAHDSCLDHDTGPGHPECAARLRAVRAALEGEAFMFLDRRDAPRATIDQLTRVHPADHVRRALAIIPETGWRDIDGDTVISPGSGEAALRAAGAVVAAVDAVMDGQGRNAFCAVRPPGHHAEPERIMGFCLFNNVAIGALHARAAHGARRVAVVDFDVHHGNGTQAIFWNDPNLFYASIHQAPLFPGTGHAHETGGHGNIVNIPLPAGAGSPEFRDAMARDVLPALERFGPDLLMISAGFDAHALDPLAGLDLTEDDFAWATSRLGALAADLCCGRIVSTLEGGYHPGALAASAAAHVRELLIL